MCSSAYPSLWENKYIAKNSFNGTPEYVTPALSLLDEKYTITQTLEGHSLHTGFLLFDFMNCDDNGGFITYWEALSDTIYAVVMIVWFSLNIS